MNQDPPVEKMRSDTPSTHAVWACIIIYTVMLSLLISGVFIRVCHYHYYVAKLDFQSSDSHGARPNKLYFESVWEHQHRAVCTVYKPPSGVHKWNWVGEKPPSRNSLDDGLDFLVDIVRVFFYWYLPALIWILVFGTVCVYRLLVRSKFLAAIGMVLSIVAPWWVVLVVGPDTAHAIEEYRTSGYIRITEKGAPIIHALNSFHTKHGNYPRELSELVPQYLPEIPKADIPACPDFNYTPRKKYNSPDSFVIPTYELNVRMYHVEIHTETPYRLYYKPEQKYYGRKINTWAIKNELSYLIP